jgi:superfamily I DNA/RNA helicase
MYVLQLRDGMLAQTAVGGPAFRKLIVLELTAEQRRAVEASYDECFAILGAPATGKTTALLERVARAREVYPCAEPLVIEADAGLDEYAAALLASRGTDVALVDDVAAELAFTRACVPLFALEWEEFARDQLDPEVPGLRTPERFLASAFRLIRRLRDADVSPEAFLSSALRGATEFYAKPPNFSDPKLLAATKSSYHDSLDVTPDELARQRLRELDLAKILAKLYQTYIDFVESTGQMTGRDAVIAARSCLRQDEQLARRLRERHRAAFVDEAQDLTNGQLGLLAAIFGERLPGVTLCGDPSAAISSARRTQPVATFARAASSVQLRRERRPPRLETARTSTPREEAQLIVARVAAWLDEGIAPQQIAVLFRSVRNVELYETALLDHDIPTTIAGDANLFEDRRALDALALLWNVHDPFRHDWLLRTLTNGAVGLSDASLAILCREPADAQRQLFAFEDEPAPTARASRWDPRRDLRLGWNVIRGEQDSALEDDAAARVQRFRSRRERWLDVLTSGPLETFARTVWREGLAREGSPGSARAAAQQVVLRRLLARLNEFLRRNGDAPLADVLVYAEQRRESDLETCAPLENDGTFVKLLSVEAARGRQFDKVIVANVRPGAFPFWYAPESFLFSPGLGVIPKENSGDARSARTAKFSYYMFRAKASQRYNQGERRAFDYALSRARSDALVTASGTPTRGLTAPEFLEELRVNAPA